MHITLLEAGLDLVLPGRCVGCAAPGPLLCAGCLRPGELTRTVRGLGTVHAAAEYDGAIRTALVHYKERGRHGLLRPLAALLDLAVLSAVSARAVGLDLNAPAVLVPVPSSRRAARRRGGDHMCRLARATGVDLGLPVWPILRPGREGIDSAGLDAAQRRENVIGTLRARSIGGLSAAPPVIVLDDIVTTGATLGEAATVLAASGWTVLGAAAVASTPAPVRARRPADRYPESARGWLK